MIKSIEDMTKEEMLDFAKNSKSWDEKGVQEAIEKLCDYYDIPLKDEFGEWVLADELIISIENAMKN